MTETVSVQLDSGINYVNGTVNSVDVSFTLTAENTWSATVEKSADGRYDIIITAYDTAGNSTTIKLVQYKMDAPWPFKTDWKSTDSYNYGEMDRVEANTRYVYEYLVEKLGYSIPPLAEAKLRDYSSVDYLGDINRIENEIKSLSDHFYTPQGYLGSKVWTVQKPFDYTDANRLETNLKLLLELAENVPKSWYYSGTISTGQGGLN